MIRTDERYFRIDDLKSFCNREAKKTIFYQSEQSAGAVWCIKPGQSLCAHSHKIADDVWIVLEGQGTFYTNDGETRTIGKGEIIVSYPGDIHGVTNTSDENFVMLGFATPMPLDFIECETPNE